MVINKQLGLTYVYLLVYILLSSGVILYNKWVLSPKYFDFPYPITLTMIHMGFSGLVAFFLVRVFKVATPVKMTFEIYATCVIPISAFFASSLWFGNTAYLFISVAFIQMLKALMPVATFVMAVICGTDKLRWDILLNMVLVSIGVVVSSYGEIHFNIVGTVYQVTGIYAEALALVLTQVLLQKKGLTLNPMTSLYYIAPCSFVFLFVPWYLLEKPGMEVSQIQFNFWIFFSNALSALALNLSIFLVIGRTSAVTIRVAGVLKDWILIALSTVIFPKSIITTLDRTEQERRSSPEKTESLEKVDQVSTSSTSGEVSLKSEKEVEGGSIIRNGYAGEADVVDGSRSVASVSNGGGTAGGNFSRVNTLPPEILSADKLEPALNYVKLERAKTERQRHHNILSEEAAQIFDDKIPVQQKLKLLNRIATVKDDGTVEFEVPGDVEPRAIEIGSENASGEADDMPLDDAELRYIPPLQIVMLIVGARGDVQPFIAIGKKLQDYGHRVRLATHSNFKEFVMTSGLEFYPLGGDPKVLAGYVVKNKGFLPSGPSEIPIQRNQMKEIINSLYPACKEPDIDTGVPFKADAIIANPPAYGHTHVAEALKVPLHIFFTMPWTPTSEFPHPLSRVKQPAGYRLSYQIVDSLIWLGIRDMINDVRKKKLKLRPVTYLSGSQGSESDIPHGYIWSPHLVPKPKDWGQQVDVVGFCFLDLASNYQPPEPLVNWLNAGPKPIYIGFGSLPVQEPEKMTQIIVEALEITGQRGIINKGWGGLGNLAEPKDFIYLLDNIPHDWLFLQCAAVVHHGGAGTTAAGLKAACPTTIVPFFGDQPFWGERVHARGVGPAPIPVDEFTLPKLVDAIKFMLDPEIKERALALAKAMEDEDGVTGAVRAFLKHLPRKKLEPEPVPAASSFLSIRKSFGCS